MNTRNVADRLSAKNFLRMVYTNYMYTIITLKYPPISPPIKINRITHHWYGNGGCGGWMRLLIRFSHPCQISDKDSIFPIWFPGVDRGPSQPTDALGCSLGVNTGLNHASLLLSIVASRTRTWLMIINRGKLINKLNKKV